MPSIDTPPRTRGKPPGHGPASAPSDGPDATRDDDDRTIEQAETVDEDERTQPVASRDTDPAADGPEGST